MTPRLLWQPLSRTDAISLSFQHLCLVSFRLPPLLDFLKFAPEPVLLRPLRISDMDLSIDPAQLALLESVKHNVKLAQTLGACGFAICL
jgi:hypothetical protein